MVVSACDGEVIKFPPFVAPAITRKTDTLRWLRQNFQISHKHVISNSLFTDSVTDYSFGAWYGRIEINILNKGPFWFAAEGGWSTRLAAAAKQTNNIVKNYNSALQVIPDNQDNIRKEKERQARLDKYTKDLVLYAKGEIKELDVPKSITPWSEERIEQAQNEQK